jgi:KDO2-lipid IV(A) lauroyltransferase
MSLRQLRYLGEYVAFRSIVCLANTLPTRASVQVTRFLAFVVHRLLPRKLTRYQVARDNIRHAFGDRYGDDEIDRLIYEMWVHLFRLLVDAMQMPRKLRRYNCLDQVRFRRLDAGIRVMSTGRPVMVISGHFGNWELATYIFGLFGFPIGVVARDLDNPYMNRWYEQFRQRVRHIHISKNGGGADMVSILEQGGYLALLADQDAGRRGLFVNFFGRSASTFKSIALLALQHRALICVGYAYRLKDDFINQDGVRYEMGCEEIIDPLDYDGVDAIPAITQRYTAALERVVRRAPEQYFWVHRRWKSAPRKRKLRRPAA